MAYTFRHGDRPLDGYTIQRAVGRGGFGEVYYALTDSGKQVAIKYLRENADVELRGISMVMNLKSPHLITIYDVKQDANREPFVIMEYVSGPSLRDLLLAEPNGLGVQKTAFFLGGMAKGLSYLHDRGIVHRDLKPGNIFYDDGYVKIGDYGLSKHISVSRHSGQTVSVGTVHYMAPEIGSGSYSKAIDIYALGVIVYEMLTGRLPFSGASMAEILMRHLSERPDLAGIPEPFTSVIAKALAKDPKDRYQDVNEMADAILSAVQVSEGLSTFDPNTLSHVPRADQDIAATVTRTPHLRPPPPPPMDVHTGLPEEFGTRFQDRAEELGRKFQDKAAEWQRKITGRSPSTKSPDPAEIGYGSPKPPPPGRSRKSQFLVLLAAVGAVGVGLGLVGGRGQEEAIPAVMLLLAGGIFGPLLAHFKVLASSFTRNTLVDRIAYAGFAALLMVPGAVVAEEVRHNFINVMVPMVAVIGLCDWGKRIEAGRRGRVEGGEAIWPGILGLIVGAMVDAHVWTAAALCASLSLLVQVGAAIWPHSAEERGPARPQRRGNVSDAFAGAAMGAAQNFKRAVGRREPDAAARETPQAVDVIQSAPELRPVPAPLRLISSIACAVLLAVSLGCFFANLAMSSPPGDPTKAEWRRQGYPYNGTDVEKRAWGESQRAWSEFVGFYDTKAGLLFGTLAPVGALVFFGRKALQRHRLPFWRGTLRWLIASAGLCLSAGMIAILAYQPLDQEERAAAVFGLVAGSTIALVCMAIPGPGPATNRRPRARKASPPPALVSEAEFSAARAQRDVQEQWRAPADPSDRRTDQPIDARVEQESSPAAAVFDAAPSFVGKTANAGLSILGKLLLVCGFLAAVAFHTAPFKMESDDSSLVVTNGRIALMVDGHKRVDRAISPAVVLAPIIGGCVLLLLARRNDGGFHLARVFVAGVFGVGAAIMVLGPAKAAMEPFFRGDWDSIRDPAPLMAGAAFLALSLVLLFWPKRRNAIVI